MWRLASVDQSWVSMTLADGCPAYAALEALWWDIKLWSTECEKRQWPVPNEALAKFMTRLATAAQELAEELQSGGDAMAPEGEAGSPPNLGSRQEKVYRILASADDEGLPTSAIAAEMKYEVLNTYLTLQSLARLGLAELIPGSKPQRWRLHPRQRGTAGPTCSRPIRSEPANGRHTAICRSLFVATTKGPEPSGAPRPPCQTSRTRTVS
jgi:hypothetical protein